MLRSGFYWVACRQPLSLAITASTRFWSARRRRSIGKAPAFHPTIPLGSLLGRWLCRPLAMRPCRQRRCSGRRATACHSPFRYCSHFIGRPVDWSMRVTRCRCRYRSVSLATLGAMACGVGQRSRLPLRREGTKATNGEAYQSGDRTAHDPSRQSKFLGSRCVQPSLRSEGGSVAGSSSAVSPPLNSMRSFLPCKDQRSATSMFFQKRSDMAPARLSRQPTTVLIARCASLLSSPTRWMA